MVYTVAMVLFPLGLAPLSHLAIAYPTGRLRSRFERRLVAMPYVLALPR